MKNPRVTKVHPLENYSLELSFENGETKIFDVTPYLDKGDFVLLKDLTKFKKVSVQYGSVCWEDELDFCPDTLYEDSVAYEKKDTKQ